MRGMKFLTDTKNFLTNVAQDQRIPERDKKVLLAMVALVVSPIDLIPDWIPVLGVLDDFVIICIILDYFFSVLDHQILLSHYPWGMKSFARLRKTAKALSFFVPGHFKRLVWKYTKDPYA